MKEATRVKIALERQRQDRKFGAGQFKSMAAERVLAVLIEEVGEIAKSILERTNAEEEIIHVAAVAAGWLDECYSE